MTNDKLQITNEQEKDHLYFMLDVASALHVWISYLDKNLRRKL